MRVKQVLSQCATGLIAVTVAAPVANNEVPYQCYHGSWQNFPAQSQWVSLETMFENARGAMRGGCLKGEPQNSEAQIDLVFDSVRKVGQTSGIDPRFIFAIVMQESNGCVNVIGTKNPDPNGPFNPGLMQSHSGFSFVGNWASPSAQAESLTQMIRDGTQGTSSGDGLQQCLNQFGNFYEAARCYNSGSLGVTKSDLNNGGVATASYVNDVANRLMGWVWGKGSFETCPRW